MDRKYFNIDETNTTIVHKYLANLTNQDVTIDEYRNAFYILGSELGKVVVKNDNQLGHVMIVCASEDADWLANGLINIIGNNDVDVAVFWLEREKLSDEPLIEISPIIKEFVDKTADCDTMIITKSIISTACVVKTQLNKMISMMMPKKIKIVSPVMYKDAETNLKKEFPESIYKLFEYITFAVDSELDDNHMVIPGIGGSVYSKLGLGVLPEKNMYMPNLVKRRLLK